jgi:hypothetical protein
MANGSPQDLHAVAVLRVQMCGKAAAAAAAAATLGQRDQRIPGEGVQGGWVPSCGRR